MKQIKRLLIMMSIPLAFYVLSLLKFIFIPLFAAIFVSVLFMPLVRKMAEKNIPGWLSIIVCVGIIISLMFLGIQVIKISSGEIINADPEFLATAEQRFEDVSVAITKYFAQDEQVAEQSAKSISIQKAQDWFVENGANLVGSIMSNISRFLMFLFFLVLLLANTLDMQKLMHILIFNQKLPSIRTFIKIEKSIVKFIWVKFLLSLFTGIGFTIACYAFDVSFPIFWGFFTFAINFVQMIGSVIAVIVVTIFGVIEISAPGTLLTFSLVLTGVQVLFGGILEPILMGKSFSINTITVLIMLALWGFVWGIPGLIMSVPITVLVKTIMEQIPDTKKYADLMS
ncbi:AI-2E family transporter [Parvicella tangerina]|uniref:AI-2E family transporter n=1 Tax=Parvicella tangerina TaxID=2829795 RepID=UPI00215C6964|nr:AI-2E family transporter [Parvicella tangerina]